MSKLTSLLQLLPLRRHLTFVLQVSDCLVNILREPTGNVAGEEYFTRVPLVRSRSLSYCYSFSSLVINLLTPPTHAQPSLNFVYAPHHSNSFREQESMFTSTVVGQVEKDLQDLQQAVVPTSLTFRLEEPVRGSIPGLGAARTT